MTNPTKKRALVVCPGRGTYTKETLGYIRQYGVTPWSVDFLRDIDARRKAIGEPTISDLDYAETFQPQLHTRGEHASSLIYACAYTDFMAINRDAYDIVAITGNSMGWYLTLAFGGALDWNGAFQVINGMGSMMKEEIIGGQVIYPITDEQWRPSREREAIVNAAFTKARAYDGAEIYLSISLGGFVVFGGNRAGVNALLRELPPVENYPFQLINHAAFHTPLLRQTAARAFTAFSEDLFHKPTTPLIDGRGCIWQPYSTATEDLYNYTLGHQVVEPYDFTRAIGVGMKEFAPDVVILLGPGSSLGGAVAQTLIANNWWGLDSKAAFTQMQAEAPRILAMGRPDQRARVTKSAQ